MSRSAQAVQRDREIVDRYTDQPARLPAALRRSIEGPAGGGGDPVLLYALCDLDARLELGETWLALGARRVTIARRRAGERPAWDLTTIDRAQIREAHESPGLSCHVLRLLGPPGEEPLAVLRYTQRQRRAVNAIRFLLDRPGPPAAGVAEGTDEGADADDAYANAVAGPIREAQLLVSRTDRGVILRLLGYLRPYRREVTLGMSAAALVTLLSLVPPYLAGYLIDKVVRRVQAGELAPEAASRVALVCVVAIAAAYALRSAFTWVRLRLMSFLGEWVARDLRTEVYEHLGRLSVSFFSRKKTGSLITRVTSDTDRLWEFLAFGIVDVSLSAVMLVGLGAVLLSLDWRLGLVMILPVPLLCLGIFLHGRYLERFFLRAWRQWSRLTDVVSDTIPGVRVIKAFHQEESERRRFEERNQAAAGEFTQIHAAWTRFWPALLFGIHCLTVAVWALALPRLIGEGGPRLSAGTFVAFLLYTTMFVNPIEVVGQMTRVLNRATSSAHRIFEVLDTEPEVVDRPQPVRLAPVRGQVRFERVWFGYEGSRPVLRGLDFEVAAGEMIGLVGPSGGGKTTIANLIARFYDPSEGVVRVDGVDLRALDSGHFRRQVGMVLQDAYLFHGTIAENIRYGLPGAGPEQVIAAARAANAHDFVCRLPHGYDTVVGERGHTLSGGERQRVSIARALLHDPRILILDEATSAVDTETERNIDEAMHRLIAGRTVFAIAHRLSTLRRANRLFVIENGALTESGTHAQLMSNPRSTYRRLVELQREVQHAI